jgi:hypothetical protein
LSESIQHSNEKGATNYGESTTLEGKNKINKNLEKSGKIEGC